MKALVVRQPWASLIARGRKTIEVRSRRTSHRGELLIVAGKVAEGDAPADLPRGVAVAVVTVTDCRPFTPADADAARSDWRPGLWAWTLADAKPLPPLTPVRGMPGLFNVDFSSPFVSASASA